MGGNGMHLNIANLEKGKLVLSPFDYGNVELLDSHFKDQFDEMVEYFLNIPEDDMLLGYRRRAGLPHPGNELPGWYGNESSFNVYEYDEIFNTLGQWMSLFGRASRIASDPRVKARAKSLVHKFNETIADDGYFFYSNNCNAWCYEYEKFASGLLDCYVYADIDEALDVLHRITDWAIEKLPRNRCPVVPYNDPFYEGATTTINGTAGDPAIKAVDVEWFTLVEVLDRAYLVTGDKKFGDFAKVWHYDHYWNAILNDDQTYLMTVHAYSHVNGLGGPAMAYRVIGEPRFKEIILAAYEMLSKNQLLASGGYGLNETFADEKGTIYKKIEKAAQTVELCCCTWAGFKLVRHLISISGGAKFGDWVETMLYNSIGAIMPITDDDYRRGKTFYYSDLRIGGGRKRFYPHSYPCCAGTYPQAICEYYNLIYYQDDNGIYVTQYLPSRLTTELKGKPVGVTVTGDFPKEDNFQVTIDGEGEFAVTLRIPSWLRRGEGKVTVNGMDENVLLEANEWAKIERKWSKGDVIEVTFPMHMWLSPIHKTHPERSAFMYGPIMLAADGRHWVVEGDIHNPEAILKDVGDLHFTGKDSDGNELFFRPYWEYQEGEWYTVYFDVKKQK
jgi:DUF1680 family protein